MFVNDMQPYNRITFGKQCYYIKELYKWVLSNGGANKGEQHFDTDGQPISVTPTEIPCLTFPDKRVELTKEDLNKLLIAFNDIPETERYAKNDPKDASESVVPSLDNTIRLTKSELTALRKTHKPYMPALSESESMYMSILNYLKIKYEINEMENEEFRQKLNTLDEDITRLLNKMSKNDNIIPILKTHVNNLIEHPKYIFLSDYGTEIRRVEQMKTAIEQIMSHPAEQTIDESNPVINIQTEIEIHKQHLEKIATQLNNVNKAYIDLLTAQDKYTGLTTKTERMTQQLEQARRNVQRKELRLNRLTKELADTKGKLYQPASTFIENATLEEFTEAIKQATTEVQIDLLSKTNELQNQIDAESDALRKDEEAVSRAEIALKQIDIAKDTQEKYAASVKLEHATAAKDDALAKLKTIRGKRNIL